MRPHRRPSCRSWRMERCSTSGSTERTATVTRATASSAFADAASSPATARGSHPNRSDTGPKPPACSCPTGTLRPCTWSQCCLRRGAALPTCAPARRPTRERTPARRRPRFSTGATFLPRLLSVQLAWEAGTLLASARRCVARAASVSAPVATPAAPRHRGLPRSRGSTPRRGFCPCAPSRRPLAPPQLQDPGLRHAKCALRQPDRQRR